MTNIIYYNNISKKYKTFLELTPMLLPHQILKVLTSTVTF